MPPVRFFWPAWRGLQTEAIRRSKRLVPTRQRTQGTERAKRTVVANFCAKLLAIMVQVLVRLKESL